MPANPSVPPNGTYTSTIDGDLSDWSGSFTYTNGAISYTRSNPNGTYSTTNTSQGNAIVFKITAGSKTIHFDGPTYTSLPGNKAKYSGNVNDNGPGAGEDGWTATQG